MASLINNNMTPTPAPEIADMWNEIKPVGFIGTQIYKPLKLYKKAGTVYYQDYQTIGSATYGRAAGGTVSRNANTAAKTTFDLDNNEILAPEAVDVSEIATGGGEDAMKAKLAKKGFRNVAKKIEDLVIAALPFSSSTDVSGDIYGGVRAAVDNLKVKVAGYPGKMILAGCSMTIQAMRTDDVVLDLAKNIGIAVGDGNRFISNVALAETLGVSEVLEGLNGVWPYNKVALVWVPLGDDDPTVEPQVGRLTTYIFRTEGMSGESPVMAEVGYDPAIRSPYIDFVAFADALTFNADFAKCLQVSATTTTTTTTTAG